MLLQYPEVPEITFSTTDFSLRRHIYYLVSGLVFLYFNHFIKLDCFEVHCFLSVFVSLTLFAWQQKVMLVHVLH